MQGFLRVKGRGLRISQQTFCRLKRKVHIHKPCIHTTVVYTVVHTHRHTHTMWKSASVRETLKIAAKLTNILGFDSAVYPVCVSPACNSIFSETLISLSVCL